MLLNREKLEDLMMDLEETVDYLEDMEDINNKNLIDLDHLVWQLKIDQMFTPELEKWLEYYSKYHKYNEVDDYE